MKACACGCTSFREDRIYRSRWGPIEMVLCTECGLARNVRDYDYEATYDVEANVYKAPTEEEFDAELPRMERYLRLVSAHRDPPGSMLDIGCNAGHLMCAFQSAGWSVRGIDLNADVVASARARDLDATQTSLEACRFPDASFDLVALCHTLEHIPRIKEMVVEIRRLLKEGGLILVAVPNFGSRSDRLIYGNRWPAFLPMQHIWYFTRTTLDGTLAHFGFESVETRSLCSHRTDEGALPARLLKRLVVWWQRLADDGNELGGVFRVRPTDAAGSPGASRSGGRR